ncbi:hypothetical protein GQ55_5G434700 [Panicum hallii var. hallii]|uniref:Uncharacterized protein n=1 Tax=Panicum hallii var. hallii TaxID=1504633 RepID=A0A2T7DPK7_9POAL|nr:hypothetical protein GQ55_5G434700 [Panicum hallii var. hallii]
MLSKSAVLSEVLPCTCLPGASGPLASAHRGAREVPRRGVRVRARACRPGCAGSPARGRGRPGPRVGYDGAWTCRADPHPTRRSRPPSGPIAAGGERPPR